jgi:hypothetical protein
MKESKLTKYTLLGCALVLIAYFSTSARADDDENTIVIIAGSCAAAQAIVAEQLVEKHEFAGNAILDEAQWWKDFLIDWVEDEKLATNLIGAFAKQIQGSYNDGDLSWEELVNVAHTCSLTKLELQETMDDE